MQYSDKDLEALISEVETEFQAHFQKSEDSTEVEAQAEEKETQELAKNEDQVSEEDTLGYDEEDIKEMNELYAGMSKSEKEAHYKAIKSVLFTGSEEDSNEDSNELAKSEDGSIESKESTDNDSEILAKNEELVKENEELKKSVGKLVALLTEKVKKGAAPKQKAITEIQYMKKSEEEVIDETNNDVDVSTLSKAEITAKLREKSRSSDLKKSDRDRINAYMFDEIGIDKIKDLL